MSRLARTLTAGAVAATTAVGAPAAVAKSCGQPVKVAYSKGWTVVPWPALANGPGSGVDTPVLGIDPTAPNTMYASDGTTLLATTDGGCTWSTRFTATDATTAGLVVSRVIVAPVPHGRPLVYVVLDTARARSVAGTSSALLRSNDGAKTFSRADVGLPWAGSNTATVAYSDDPQQTEVDVAPGDGHVLYVRMPTNGGLWGSDDAGATWSLRHPLLFTDWHAQVPADLEHDKSFQCCVVDPLAPHDVWGTTEYGVVHSTNGGKTFTLAVNPGKHIVARSKLAVSHRRGRPAVVTFQRADDETVWGTRDGGRHWGPLFGGMPARWRVDDLLGGTPTGLLAFAKEAGATKIVQIRESRGVVAESDMSGGWFNRFVAATAAATSTRVSVAVVEWGYQYPGPTMLIERRTLDLG